MRYIACYSDLIEYAQNGAQLTDDGAFGDADTVKHPSEFAYIAQSPLWTTIADRVSDAAHKLRKVRAK